MEHKILQIHHLFSRKTNFSQEHGISIKKIIEYLQNIAFILVVFQMPFKIISVLISSKKSISENTLIIS